MNEDSPRYLKGPHKFQNRKNNEENGKTQQRGTISLSFRQAKRVDKINIIT